MLFIIALQGVTKLLEKLIKNRRIRGKKNKLVKWLYSEEGETVVAGFYSSYIELGEVIMDEEVSGKSV